MGGPPLEQIDRELAALGVPRRWVVTRSATRVCTTILDRTTGTMTELVENGRPLASEELDEFRRAYAEEAAKASVAVLTGSLPTGTPERFYRELVERTPCPVVLDFRGPGLLATLDCRPLVVKPNREELAQTVGRLLDDDGGLLEAMRSLNAAGPSGSSSRKAPGRCGSLPSQRPIGCTRSGRRKSSTRSAAATPWRRRWPGRSAPAGRWLRPSRFGMAAAAENLGRLETCRLDPARVQERAKAVRLEEVS